MIDFLFIQEILFEYFGPMYLSSTLKARGYDCDLLVLSKEKDIFSKIDKLNPKVLMISTTTGPHKTYLNFLKEFKKKFNIPTLLGGPHATFFPEVLNNQEVDFICMGEGENFVVDFATALFSNKKLNKIPNLGYKINNKPFYNPLGNLIENLDNLPFPDRELYYNRYPELIKFPTKRFIASRGCPYNCSFCFNHSLKQLYSGKGKYVRYRSAENIVQEIIELYIKHPFRSVRFSDDSFSTNKEWLLEFLKLYKRKVPLPFSCLVRGNELNEEVATALKEANCINVFFGIESGNEQYRNEVLKKSLKDKDIFKTAKLLKKANISFGTYNMFGLPGETLEDAFKTIKINSKINTLLPSSSILQPYPKTDIVEYAKENNFLNSELDIDTFDSMTSGSLLNQKDKNALINLSAFFFPAVRFPSLIPIIKILIKLPPNPAYRLLSYLFMGWVRLKAHNISFGEGIKLATRFFNHI